MTAQTQSFQTEVKQLLKLMIHSLYSNKEIFLRELISNASDAADKLRFAALADNDLYQGDADLKVRISFDKDAKTITIEDNGIGMSREEAVEHLGTIAKSGTSEFFASLTGDKAQDSQLIGQFGVGFYSSFIVAQQVDVYSRKAGLPAEQGIHWSSQGEGEFSIAEQSKDSRGTKIVLTLRDDESEFLNDWRLRSLVTKYSDHIGIPVELYVQDHSQAEDDSDDDAKDVTPKFKWEKVNQGTALWTRNKSELKDEDYNEFYHHIAHDGKDPLTWSHNRVEGKQEYTSLLYVPSNAPMDLWQRDGVRGLKLYVQRVFIMDRAEEFLPLYLRFIKGVVDSKDLSLNVSREILQQDSHVSSMKKGLTKRVLSMLEKLAEDGEKYAGFWQQFGSVLKEGPAEDFANKERIAGLLRFASTVSSKEDQTLDQYLERMQEGQKHIYYVIADSYKAAAASPHLEIFRKKGIEVLLLSDRVDEWLMSHLAEYKGKTLKDIAKGKLDLSEEESKEQEKAEEKANEEHKDLLARFQEVLKEQVNTVRVSTRLTESTACLVREEFEMGAHLRRILEAAGQSAPESKPTLEINPEHPLLQKISSLPAGEQAESLIRLVHDQACIAEGSELSDPAGYISTLNKLLSQVSV